MAELSAAKPSDTPAEKTEKKEVSKTDAEKAEEDEAHEPPAKKPRKHTQAERLEAMKKVRAARAQPIGKHMQVQIVDALEGVSESVQEFMSEFTPILKSLQVQTSSERKQERDQEPPVAQGVEHKGAGTAADGQSPSVALLAGGVLLGGALIYAASRSAGLASQDPFYPGRASKAPLPPPTLPADSVAQQAVNQQQLLPDWARQGAAPSWNQSAGLGPGRANF